MTWKEVIEYAKAGKKIRNDTWKSGWYVTLDMETLLWNWGNNAVWYVGNSDITDNWELYDEEEKPKSAWKCCKKEPAKHSRYVIIRKKTDRRNSIWVGCFILERCLKIHGLSVPQSHLENYEYCELPE